MAHQKLSVADAIAHLREEISRARQEGAGKDVRFATKEIEVELLIGFEAGATAEAGVSNWIPFVDFGVKAETGASSHNKIRLTLTIDENGDPAANLINADERSELLDQNGS